MGTGEEVTLRPSVRPSGMEKKTEANFAADRKGATGQKKRRGCMQDVGRVDREVVLRADVPAGSRFKGYKSCFVLEVVLRAEITHYQRKSWITADGKTVLAHL